MSGSLARDVRRTPLTGSAFIRTLASLQGVAAPAAPDAFAQRLAQWFDWTHAFSLSAALGDAGARSDVPTFGGQGALQADEREFARVRAALQKAIAEAPDGAPAPRRVNRPIAGAAAAAEVPVDFATYRQRYTACQLAMETQIVPLRRRLRSSLADRSAALAKLAELDIVMEQVVGAQERALLATVGARLEPRFDQLRAAQGDASPGPWLERFRQEMRGLLLAELDLRLQPIEGLLEACRQSLQKRS
ncbi:DUF3348 family protein [Scleromatobacter humisilvae]|uniref:DUF3348 domain-containing protein n=1 Tax=Scleromatobacter humisilvae TaxID=2897159 RepID=A0A9X1YJQ6_9BURK|nr:DUF3348 family protein [Scleromatobacter humisilvae]MCK9686952.1 DUF3348 domain-containing protein [Scleromatobacter humisilvae]